MKLRGAMCAIGVAMGLVCPFLGCAPGGQRSSPGQQGPVTATRETPSSQPSAGYVLLEGTVVQKPWTKSFESWNAGGSEYYVLDVGDARVEQRTAREGVLLCPTEKVPFADFATYKGKRVRVTGTYVAGHPYKPSSRSDQYPVDIFGEPALVGAGFAVHQIEIVRSDSGQQAVGP